MKRLTQLLLLASMLSASAFASTPGRVSMKEIAVTPVITAGAYTAGMQLGAMQVLDVGIDSGSGATLFDLSVVDLDKQKAAIDIFFFKSQPTFTNAEHVALAMTNANALLCIGSVSITAGAYKDTAAQSIATVANLWQKIKPVANATKVWAVAVSRGTPTYTTTSSLQFIYHLEQN